MPKLLQGTTRFAREYMGWEHCPTPGEGACAGWCGTHCGPLCCASDRWLLAKVRSRFGRELGAPDPAVSTSADQRMRVVIWQGEKNRVGRLAYMYWPVMGTLIGGFLEAAPSVQLEVGVGFSLRYHAALARLRRGDALVWVGVNGQYSQPWTKLRARGVKTILYNTEPSGLSRRSPLCTATRYAVDELWDFSRYNLDRCARSYNRPNRTRYLPPGYPGRRAAPPATGHLG